MLPASQMMMTFLITTSLVTKILDRQIRA